VYFVNTGLYFAEPKIIEELEENRPVEFPDIIKKYKSGEKNRCLSNKRKQLDGHGQFDEMEKMKRSWKR